MENIYFLEGYQGKQAKAQQRALGMLLHTVWQELLNMSNDITKYKINFNACVALNLQTP